MELNFSNTELNDLRNVLRMEIKNIKKDIRASDDKKVISSLYNSIDNYEALERKIFDYMKRV